MTFPARLLTSAALCLAAVASLAQDLPSDGIAVKGRLSDRDFYRLATCGALPGQACRSPALRWTKRELTLRIAPAKKPTPTGFHARLLRAATAAVAQINGAGADILVTLVTEGPADITILPTDLAEGTVLTDTPGFSGSGVMGVGYMTVWSNEANTITEAVILISTDITRGDLPSVMLEEVTQSLGFLYDIEGPAYEGVSILSQTSNATLTITGQDAALLQMHYPRKD